MNQSDRYVKLVEWSDEDGCFIGSCPALFYGGCHGTDARIVFSELCDIVEEVIQLRGREDDACCPPGLGPIRSSDGPSRIP